MSDDAAPSHDSGATPPVLSRSLDEELKDPFGPVEGTSLYRRPLPTDTGAPATSLAGSSGRTGNALLDPLPPAPTSAPAPDEWAPAPAPAPPPPPPVTEFAAPAPAPVAEPLGAVPPPAGRAPGDPAPSSGAAAPAAPAPPVGAPPPPPPPPPPPAPGAAPLAPPPPPAPPGEGPDASWLPAAPSTPAWVPPGARVPPGGGEAAWAPASGPPPEPARPVALIAVGAVVAVVVLVALVVAGVGALRREPPAAIDPPAVEPEVPETWDPRIEPIATWVADERDLAFDHPVEVVLQPEDEYLAQAAGEPSAEDEEARAEVEDFVGVLRALGLVEGEVDLTEAGSDLASEGTLAYYDPEVETVFVRGDELTPAVRVTLAHELTHVLQDQHFDLGRIADPDFDRATELRAIAEGDAERIESAYAEDQLTDAEREEYEATSADDASDGEAALADVPPVLSLLFAAPYTLGEGYLGYLEAVGGADPYDAALEDPPSEQELLDPSAHGTARTRSVNVEVEAPEGAEVIEESTFDPLTWYLLLASRGEAGAALEIVDGWGGDAYVSYRLDGEVCAAMAVKGDDDAATDRFFFALTTWAGGVPGGAATVTRVGDAVEVQACDPGEETADAGHLTVDLLAVPYLRADLEASLLTIGSTAEQARCASTAVLGELTLEELVDPNPSAEVVQAVQDRVRVCTA